MAGTDKLTARIRSISNENIPRIYSLIAQIDELKGRWSAGARLHPQTLGSLKRSVLITSTGASTRIEGARLSDEDVEKLMRGISIQKFSDRDKAEVRGYYELLVNVFDSWQTLRMSEGLIKSFHKQLLRYVEKDVLHRGDYKHKENKVIMIDRAGNPLGVLFDTTPAYLTPFAMQELMDWVKNESATTTHHPLLVVGSFLVEFLKIHPFEDGNGRLSRILTNLLLLQAGYAYIPYVSHEKLIEDNKPEYYIALRKCQNTFGTKKQSIEPWLLFFLEVVHKQATLAVDLLSGEHIEQLLSDKQLAVWQYIQNKGEATTGDIINATGIARATVKQALGKLLQVNKIERLGLGRAARYRKK